MVITTYLEGVVVDSASFGCSLEAAAG